MPDYQALGDDLVETIYASMLGEASWQEFVDRLNGLAPGALSTFFFHMPSSNSGNVAFVSGTEGREAALASYEDYYSKLNPWMRRVAATPVGRGVIGEEIVARDDFNASEYYNDYVNPNGLETGIGLTIFKDERCYFVLSTLTGDRDTDRNLERAEVLTRIAPSLTRVFRYYRSGAFHAAALDLGEGIGAAANIGFILVNEQMRVVKANTLGEQALNAGPALGIGPLGNLRFANPDLQARLQNMLERRKVTPAERVHVDSLSGIRLIRVGGDAATEFFAGPMVAILIGGLQVEIGANIVRLATAYGLTPAELRVFSDIVGGRSINDIATAAGLGRETVRSQLKAVYAKTGLSSQADLVRLATGLINQ